MYRFRGHVGTTVCALCLTSQQHPGVQCIFKLFNNVLVRAYCFFIFFFNDTATTEIYTLSLHDALPICDPTARWLLLVPLVVFPVLVLWQNERVARVLRRAERGGAFSEKGLDRLDERWMGKGQSGQGYLDEHHLCALDLDLFGRGSLFELLCRARMRKGEDTLAAWLRTPASPEDIGARQQAVDELRTRLDLREQLALLAAGVPEGVDLAAVVAWGAAAPMRVPPWARALPLILPALTVLALLAWIPPDPAAPPLVVPLLMEVAVA